jgi:flagellar M-ring protein FliF
VPATAPVNGAAQPTAAAAAGRPGSAGGRREATTNYEVDKTVRVTRNATGTIRRLTAAIVVNHRRTVDESGKVTLAPLTPAELENVNALVRETIGFNRERGDSINVVNAPFTEIEAPKEPALAIWQQPENIALARDVGKQLGLLLLAVIVIFTLIRPALKALARPPAPAARVAERVDDPLQLPLPSGGAAAPPARQDEILKIARDNPAAVASVVRSWVGTEAKGA